MFWFSLYSRISIVCHVEITRGIYSWGPSLIYKYINFSTCGLSWGYATPTNLLCGILFIQSPNVVVMEYNATQRNITLHFALSSPFQHSFNVLPSLKFLSLFVAGSENMKRVRDCFGILQLSLLKETVKFQDQRHMEISLPQCECG